MISNSFNWLCHKVPSVCLVDGWKKGAFCASLCTVYALQQMNPSALHFVLIGTKPLVPALEAEREQLRGAADRAARHAAGRQLLDIHLKDRIAYPQGGV